MANILPSLDSNHFEQKSNKISLQNFNDYGEFNYEKLFVPNKQGSLVYENAAGWRIIDNFIEYSINTIREDCIPSNDFGTVVQETLATIGLEITNAEWGKLYISTNPTGDPEYTTDISNGAGEGYMVHHLEVDGSTKINGNLIVKDNPIWFKEFITGNGVSGTGTIHIPIRSKNGIYHCYTGTRGIPYCVIRKIINVFTTVNNGLDGENNGFDFEQNQNGTDDKIWFHNISSSVLITVMYEWTPD